MFNHDTQCFLRAVAEYRARELSMGRVLPSFEEWATEDRGAVLARAQELKTLGQVSGGPGGPDNWRVDYGTSERKL